MGNFDGDFAEAPQSRARAHTPPRPATTEELYRSWLGERARERRWLWYHRKVQLGALLEAVRQNGRAHLVTVGITGTLVALAGALAGGVGGAHDAKASASSHAWEMCTVMLSTAAVTVAAMGGVTVAVGGTEALLARMPRMGLRASREWLAVHWGAAPPTEATVPLASVAARAPGTEQVVSRRPTAPSGYPAADVLVVPEVVPEPEPEPEPEPGVARHTAPWFSLSSRAPGGG